MNTLDKRIEKTEKVINNPWGGEDYRMTIIENQLAIMIALKELTEKDWKDKSVFFGNPG